MFLYIAEGPGVARRRKIEQQYEKNKGFKKIEFFKRMSTPSHPCVSTKKIQPIRSSRLAGQREHTYECLVFYIDNVYSIKIHISFQIILCV